MVSAHPAMGTPTTKRKYGVPCVWVYLHGLTFRWGRPDGYVTVLRGKHCGRETDYDVVTTFTVGTEWIEENDMRTRAQKWLRRNPNAV